MPTFSAADIIGKTLNAKKTVEVYRYNDLTKPVYKVKPGQIVGVVYSYLMPKEGREVLYWMFYDANKKPYYTKQEPGLYDIKSLRDQGVLTALEEENKNSETTGDKILKLIKTGLFIGAGAYVLVNVLSQGNEEK